MNEATSYLFRADSTRNVSNLALTWAWGQTVSDPTAKLLLLKLADQANDDGECWPSKRYLTEHIGLCARSITYKLRLLEQAGLIETVARRRENGAQTSNSYRLALHPPRATDCTPPVQAVAPLEPTEEPTESTETEPDGSVSPAQLRKQQVTEVYDYWREKRLKTDRRYDTISDNRRKKIQTRLTEFTVGDLKLAIDCVALDPWDERPFHDDLVVIFRNREQVERFLAFQERRVLPKQAAQPPPRRYGYGVTAHEMFERAKATEARERMTQDGAEAGGSVGGSVDRGLPPGWS